MTDWGNKTLDFENPFEDLCDVKNYYYYSTVIQNLTFMILPHYGNCILDLNG